LVQSYCIGAAILQIVEALVKSDLKSGLKPDRRAARRAATEARLIEAATDLFVSRGYVATTLTAVADRAELAPRTLYLHFATKAALLRRCIDVAIAGDAESIPLDERDWMTAAMTAPTLTDRIRRMAAGTARLMERTGALLDVARQAAPTEPEIAAAAQAGRDATRRTLLDFWRRAADDRLLPDGVDQRWLGETAALLAHADTYSVLTATTGWTVDTYERWLGDSWHRLVRGSEGPAPV
jgi:AcrR family transcriptional regulator